jgi:hypothetical protein
MGMWGSMRLVSAGLAAMACIALWAPGAGFAATVVNGNFESGNLSGWSVYRATTFGNWFAYKGASDPILEARSVPGKPPTQPIQAVPQGDYAAIADQLSSDTVILSQNVVLEPGTTHFLSMLAFYTSYAPIAVPALDTLAVEGAQLGGQANQQFRIDVIKPGAPLESLQPTDILATVFRTQGGAGEKMAPIQRTVDLSALAGQTVRLRIAVAATEEILAAGVDSVAIGPKPPPPIDRSDLNPRRFRLGKATANRKNGTVTLSVEVPGPGVLAAASTTKAKKVPKPVKRTQLKARGAGTLKLRLKPSSAGFAILRKMGRLRARVAVSFKEGGQTTTATKALVFKLAARPTKR